MLHDVAHQLLKRGVSINEEHYELPSWTWMIILLNGALFLPLYVIIQYTLCYLYPTFAIVEDEHPPAYEPVALSDVPDDEPDMMAGEMPMGNNSSRTISSSIRSIYRLLHAQGGIRGNFRGLSCMIAQGTLTLFLSLIFYSTLGGAFTPIATLLCTLALVQWSTAWVHIVISYPSEKPFWRRLPGYKRTFDATWLPVTMYWAALEFSRWLPRLVAPIVGVEMPEISGQQPVALPDITFGYIMSLVLIITLSVLTSIFILIPAHVILVRVQASLLPVDEDAIIPFDKSFQGAVVPAVAGGLGYATVGQAWSTFTKGAWRRLVMLYVKVFALAVAFELLAFAVIIPEVILIMQHSQRVGGQ